MESIDKAIIALNDSTAAAPWVTLEVDARCQILTTLAYLGFMLSIPLDNLEMLVWYAVYPIVWSSVCGTGYGSILRRSLIVLPFVAFIGIFNPLLDRAVALTVGGIEISRGWITFVSIVVRGMLSVQAVVILVVNVGFIPLCRALGSLGVPGFLVTQLMLLYRYMIVLLEEVRTMRRARAARGADRRLSLRMWGTLIGQLFVRTVSRAERIQQAMLARGFTGKLRFATAPRFVQGRDVAVTAAWLAIFAVLRFVNVSSLLHLQ